MHREFFSIISHIQNMSKVLAMIELIFLILHIMDGLFIIKQTKNIVCIEKK